MGELNQQLMGLLGKPQLYIGNLILTERTFPQSCHFCPNFSSRIQFLTDLKLRKERYEKSDIILFCSRDTLLQKPKSSSGHSLSISRDPERSVGILSDFRIRFNAEFLWFLFLWFLSTEHPRRAIGSAEVRKVTGKIRKGFI